MSTKVSYIGCGYNMIAFYIAWTIVKVQPVQMQGKFTKNYLFYDKVSSLRNLTTDTRQTMPDLYISQILLQLYRNVIVWERICDGGKFFCKP